jgi:hypothetical protein
MNRRSLALALTLVALNSEAYELKGLRLGMTPEELYGAAPEFQAAMTQAPELNSCVTDGNFRRCDISIMSYAMMKPFDAQYSTLADLPVARWTLSFLDGRLAIIEATVRPRIAPREVVEPLIEKYGKPASRETKPFLTREGRREPRDLALWRSGPERLIVDASSQFGSVRIESEPGKRAEDAWYKNNTKKRAKDL